MATNSFNPAQLTDEIVASGAVLNPFTGLTIVTDAAVTDTQIIETSLTVKNASDPTLTNPGKISDSTGVGAATGFIFDEVNVIATTPSTVVLPRLILTAPTLKNGQSMQDTLTIATATSTITGGPLNSNVSFQSLTVDVVTAPGISGAVATQPDGGASIKPFATMLVTDTDFLNTGLDTATITVTNAAGQPTDAEGTLTGVGLSKIGVGLYEIPNPVLPGVMTTVLQNLSFTPVVGMADTTTHFEVSTLDTKAALSSKDNITSVVTLGKGPGPNPVPPNTSPDLTVVDTTTNTTLGTLPPANPAQGKFTGSVVGVENQYINITPDSLNITANTKNWFIHSGSGTDAIDVSKATAGGTNVLDGGTNSNFLTGGIGAASKDTFFVDARGAKEDIWSTMVNFHAGDDATMWGITPAMFNVAVADAEGAAGFTGLTLHATTAGSPTTASLTLSGFTKADLTNGKLTQSFGTTSDGNQFMLIHGN